MNKNEKLLTIVGQELCSIRMDMIEALVCDDLQENELLRKAKEEGRYQNYVLQTQKVRSFFLMDNGTIYPSTFLYSTMSARANQAGCPMIPLIGSYAQIPVAKIESILDAQFVFDNGYLEEKKKSGEYMDIYQEERDGSRPIRSFIRSTNGKLYPCTFNVHTIKKKMEGNQSENEEEKEEELIE